MTFPTAGGRLLRHVALVIFVVVTSGGLFEVMARVVPSMRARVASLEPERIWEDRFLEMMQRDHSFVMAGFHRAHATRGWTVAAGAHETVDRFTYTTNERGYRSLTPYAPRADRTRVLAIGDSFTFGIETNDDATWPYLLEARDPALQVINLGVGGYGLDQMYLTLKETIAEYAPDVVVVAFIGDDLRRTLLSFRDFKKPRFLLRGDQLLLTNVPIGSPEDVVGELQIRRRWVDRSLAASFARGVYRRARGLTAPATSEPLREGDLALVTRLFDEMDALCRKHGAELLVAYFSYGEGLFDPGRREEGEEFLRRYGAARKLATLDVRPFFTDQHRTDWVKGHFQLRENLVVSAAMDSRLQELLRGRSRR